MRSMVFVGFLVILVSGLISQPLFAKLVLMVR